MTLTHTLLRWTARLLRTAIVDVVDWEELDVGEYIDPVEHVDWDDLDYEDLEEHLDEQHYRDPVQDLHDLPDEDGQIYLWECETEEGVKQVNSILESYFKSELGREPHAAHIVLADVEQLRELDPDELRVYTQPLGGDD